MTSGNPNAEQLCVQCGQKFKESENGSTSCQFHLKSAWGMRFGCCNKRRTEPGCQQKKHRSKHHYEYRYWKFIEAIGKILNSSRTHVKWASISDHDLKHNSELTASVGFVYASGQWQNHVFIVLASRWNFIAFNQKEIREIANTNANSKRLLIKSVTDETTAAVFTAEWAFDADTNAVNGVYLTIKSQTSTTPESVLCSLTFDDASEKIVCANTEVVSKGGFSELVPAVSYFNVPRLSKMHQNAMYFGPRIQETLPAESQSQVIAPKTIGKLELQIKRKSLECNKRFNYSGDTFLMELQLINMSADIDHVFSDLECIYQMVGDEKWTATETAAAEDNNNNEVSSRLLVRKFNTAKAFYMSDKESLPFTVHRGKGQTQLIQVEIFLPFANEKQPKPGQSCFSRSWLARFKPMNFQLKLKTLEDDAVVYTFQYRNQKRSPPLPNENTQLFMSIEDPISCEYHKFFLDIHGLKATPKKTTDSNNNANDDDSKENGNNNNKESANAIVGPELEFANFDKIKFAVNNRSWEYAVNDLRSIVYNCLNKEAPAENGAEEANANTTADADTTTTAADVSVDGMFELEKISDANNKSVTYHVFAYVDLRCRRLYAFRLLMTTKSCQANGYFILPIYGDIGAQEESQLVTPAMEESFFQTKKIALFNADTKVFEISDEEILGVFDVQTVTTNDGNGRVLVPKAIERSVESTDFLPAPKEIDNRLEIENQALKKLVEELKLQVSELKAGNNNNSNGNANANGNGINVDCDAFKWDTKGVVEFVAKLGEKYAETVNAFTEYGVTGEDLLGLDDEQVVSMGIKNKFLRTRLLREIAKLNK